MERYFEAKRKLFSDYTAPGWLGAVNADDEYGNSLMREFEGNAIGYSLKAGGEKPRVKLYGGIVREIGIKGMSLSVARPDGKSYEVDSPLIGEYNASNILESFVIADSLGFEIASILSGIRNCKRVPGRLERYSLSNGVTVFVDYAHSADGMEQALGTLASLSRGPIRVLWGAGGDRTPIKRPVVGNIMARLASHVVITTDNPRGEDPADIARDVERGVKNSGRCVRCDTVLDRKEAINHVLDASLPGDVVLIAGKGPERFIEYKTRKVPFVDSEAVLEWARGHSAEEILG
jgi:UDP-N-acetylmuramoyl-L-alanyl-D-glutamate--2,6-diaminopimelate ligase